MSESTLPTRIRYPDYYRGDTWGGLSSTTTVNGGDPPPSPLELARLHFRNHRGVLLLALSSADETIDIVDANTWQVSIAPRILPFQYSGLVFFDLELTAVSGLRRTPIRFEMNVIGDVTRD